MAETSVRRAVLALALGLAWASCTFPNVEYEVTCAVPTSCQNDVTNCLKQADAAQTMCWSKCTTDCGTCDVDMSMSMSIWVADCEDCSATAGGRNATGSSTGRLGGPG